MENINNEADMIENEIRNRLTGFPTIWLRYGMEGTEDLINSMLEVIFERGYNESENENERRNYITQTLNTIERELRRRIPQVIGRTRH